MLRFLTTIKYYSVRIVYRKGKANIITDYLSRPADNATGIIINNINAVDEGEGQIVDYEAEKEIRKTRLTELN